MGKQVLSPKGAVAEVRAEMFRSQFEFDFEIVATVHKVRTGHVAGNIWLYEVKDQSYRRLMPERIVEVKNPDDTTKVLLAEVERLETRCSPVGVMERVIFVLLKAKALLGR